MASSFRTVTEQEGHGPITLIGPLPRIKREFLATLAHEFAQSTGSSARRLGKFKTWVPSLDGRTGDQVQCIPRSDCGIAAACYALPTAIVEFNSEGEATLALIGKRRVNTAP